MAAVAIPAVIGPPKTERPPTINWGACSAIIDGAALAAFKKYSKPVPSISGDSVNKAR